MISAKPWSIDAVVRLFLGIIATICFGSILASLLQSEKIKMSDDHRQFAQMVLMALFVQGAALAWVGFFLRETPISWSEAFGFEAARRPKAVQLGVLAVLVFLPAALILQDLLARLMSHPEVQQAVQVLEKPDLPLIEKVFMGVLAILLAPLAEEVVFRGILYPTIKQRGYPKTALWATSLIFGLMHFNALSFVPLTAFSFLLIFLYEKTDSLWASITAHAVFNLANFLLLIIPSNLLPRFLTNE